MSRFLLFTIIIIFSNLSWGEEISVTNGIFITPDKDQVKIRYDLYLPENKGKNDFCDHRSI